MRFLFVLFSCAAVCLARQGNVVNLADGNPRVLQALFHGFQRAEGRHYKNANEARMRMKNFRGFVKDMAALNNEDEDVEYGITFFADLTDAEADQYFGVANETDIPETQHEELQQEMPQWGSSGKSWKSKYGTAKSQSTCGSCWAFSAVGVLEGMASIQQGRYTAFSEQEALDCTPTVRGYINTCKGGWYYNAWSAIKSKNHLSLASQYRYVNRKGVCNYKKYRNYLPYSISGYYQARGDANLVKALGYGPVAIGLAMGDIKRAIRGYYTGIFTRVNSRGMASHAMTLVGYASDYWEIRNSWGTRWGNQGYFKLGRRAQDMCRISSYAWYVRTARTGQELEE